MKDISLSVVIPVYNKEKYIEQAINSILEQTYLPQEIILVDDCSTDGSCAQIEAMQEKSDRIKLIRLEKNSGVSHARNVGWKNAIASYVTFMDADDFYWNRDKLRYEYKLTKEYLDKGLQICAYSKIMRVEQNGSPCNQKDLRKSRFSEGAILKPLLEWVDFETAPRDYWVPRESMEAIGGYDENRNQYEDLDVLYKLAARLPFYCTFQYGTAYRKVEGGLSTDRNGSLEKNFREVFQNNVTLLPEKEQKRVRLKRELMSAIHIVRCRGGKVLRRFGYKRGR